MNRRLAYVLSLLLLLASFQTAHAVKYHIDMTPSLEGSGFSLEMQPLQNGTTGFTITRDPSKANHPVDPRLTLVRGATLSVYNSNGLVTKCPVAPRQDKSGNLIYEFRIDNQHAKRSHFVLSEIEDYKRGDIGYLGGGTYYSFALIDFIDPKYKQQELKEEIQAAKRQIETQLQQLEIRPDRRPD